jgi:uncharacterized membrane-anchored protein YjiN (DUF445 family)
MCNWSVASCETHSRMDAQVQQLKRMKRGALAMLIVAAAVFVVCRVVDRSSDAAWIGYVEAASEAAMVGGLADWFAVTALFRRPLGLPIPHTAIIPTRKNEIGGSLGLFVQENFLQPDAIAQRVADLSPSATVQNWLASDEHVGLVAQQLLQGASGIAAVLDADEVTVHLQHAVTEALESIDFGPALASVGETVIADGRGDQLLEAGLGAVVRTLELNRDSLRVGFAVRSPWWVPGSIDERVFDKLFTGILDLLREVRNTPGHELRGSLLAQANVLFSRLRTDPQLAQRVEALRDEALHHPNVNQFVRSAWDGFAGTLQVDPASSQWKERVEMVVRRGAQSLRNDPALQQRVDGWVVEVVRTLAADHGHRAAEWIRATVQQWDPQDTADRIELQIGRDLQFVRINGTVVGGLVGLLIYAVGQLIG